MTRTNLMMATVRHGEQMPPNDGGHMSTDPTWPTQQENGEAILREMRARNGGELVRDEAGRLRLVHPATPPEPSR